MIDRIRVDVRNHGRGMLVALPFDVVRVTGVTTLFDMLAGPQWTYYLTVAGGVVACFCCFASLEAARKRGTE